MGNLILDFLVKCNARIHYDDKWLVTDKDGTTYEFTVYQQQYRKRQPITLYEGSDLEEALRILE